MGFGEFFGHVEERFRSFTMGDGRNKKKEQAPIAPEAISEWVLAYMRGQQSPREFLLRLDENKVDEYIERMEETINLAELDTDDQKEISRLNQLRRILDQGLMIEICRAKDVPYISDISRAA